MAPGRASAERPAAAPPQGPACDRTRPGPDAGPAGVPGERGRLVAGPVTGEAGPHLAAFFGPARRQRSFSACSIVRITSSRGASVRATVTRTSPCEVTAAAGAGRGED